MQTEPHQKSTMQTDQMSGMATFGVRFAWVDLIQLLYRNTKNDRDTDAVEDEEIGHLPKWGCNKSGYHKVKQKPKSREETV